MIAKHLYLRLDEFCALPVDSELSLVEIRAFNVSQEQLAAALQGSPIRNVVALDVSRLGLNDFDVTTIMDILSEGGSKLRWLKLAWNTEITQASVNSICAAVRDGLDLRWIDLVGTGFNATPYFEDPITTALNADKTKHTHLSWDQYRLMWRIPRCTRQLAEKWGWQSWMKSPVAQ